MSRGSFKKAGKSARLLYGPRAMLVCGFSSLEQKKITGLPETISIRNLPVIFASARDEKCLLRDLLARPDQSGINYESEMERAVILSGITEKELQKILSAYRRLGLPRPLWAALTPFSEKWSLSALIEELKKERAGMDSSGREKR